jgi:hypothetical protein
MARERSSFGGFTVKSMSRVCVVNEAIPKHGKVERGEGDSGGRQQHVAVHEPGLSDLGYSCLLKPCWKLILGLHCAIYESGELLSGISVTYELLLCLL